MTRNSCDARLLLVDDSPDVLLLWRVVLEVHGGFGDIIEAPDGERALQLMESAQPDVIVTDHWMRGVSGLDVINAARSLCPRAVVVISSSDPSVGPEALRRGASAFLSKYSSVTEELPDTVHDLLGEAPGRSCPRRRPKGATISTAAPPR